MEFSPARKARSIGVLVDWTVDSYQLMILNGIMDFARKAEVGCICFEGGAFRSPFDHEAQRNVIYDLAGKSVVDGLIVFAPAIGHFVSRDEIQSFCRRFHGLPMISLSLELENIPSVLVDNASGMRDLMNHLIEGHQFKHFSFIKGTVGNQDALAREKVFADTLREHGLSIDPQWIYQGDFSLTSGKQAVNYLMEVGIRDIDAIVAANDNMALSALEELSRRGIRVPEDIAVTGFDNIDMSGYSSPSLTTVRTPLYEMGWAAAKRLQDILDGKDGVPRTYISSRMVIRESCRCLNSASNYLNPPLGAAKEPVTPAVEAASRQQNPVSKSAVVPLMKGPLRPIGTGPLEIPGQSDFWEAQRQLSELWYHHRKSGPIEGSRLESENQIFQSIMEVSRQAIRSEWTRIQGFIRENIAFDLIRTLIAISNVPDQMENIAVWLPLLGIPSCYLSLYREESGKTESVCIFGCHDKNRLDVGKEGTIFPTKNLVPDDFLANGNRRMLIVESLGRIGFVVFEMQPGQGRLFNMISYLIGGALQSALLFQELQEQKNSLSLNLEHMRKVMAGFISTISATVEAKDPYTSGHQQRVSDLARSIAQQMNLPPMQVEAIRMAGIVHDLGKIYIPAEILNRPSKLDDIEWNMIKKHPKVAYDILKNIDFPWPIAEIVYQHHERLNGSGYPRGLQSDQISLESKIIAVADVVEAMSSRRPYREPLGLDKALEEVTGKKGVLYDMDAVNACAELFRSKGYRLKTEMFPTFAR